MIIRADTDSIRLDGVQLNGVIQSISVNGEIVVDTYQNNSEQYTNKLMRGYKDKTVVVVLKIVPTTLLTAYEQLEALEKIFQDTESDSPTVHMITNEHISNRGITHVIFTRLGSSEDNSDNTITATLTFEEFVSSKVTTGD